jgi:hypothetical protein
MDRFFIFSLITLVLKLAGMLNSIIDGALELPLSIFPELGSAEFNIVFFSCLATWILVARVFMGLLKSRRGFLSALIALVVPLFLGLLAYSLSTLYLLPLIGQDWAAEFLPLAMFALVSILAALVTSKWVFGLEGSSGVVVFLFASAAAVGAFFISETVLATLDQGSEQIKMREERKESTLDQIL